MSTNEGAPEKPKNRIEIDKKNDGLYVVALKGKINEMPNPVSIEALEKAAEIYRKEVMANPDDPTNDEQLEFINQAVSKIRLEIEERSKKL